MPLDVHYIAYASNITFGARIKPTTFTKIKNQAHNNNITTGITGFLLFKNKKFFQYFEGSKQSCDNLLQTLKQDIRHHNLTILSQGIVSQRQFDDWTMYCLKSKAIPKEINQGLNNFDVFNWKDPEIQKLLKLMKKYYQTNFNYVVANDISDNLYRDFTKKRKIFFILQIAVLLGGLIIMSYIILRHN